MDQRHTQRYTSLLDSFLPEHFGSRGQSIEFVVAQKFKEAHADMQHITVLDKNFPLAAFLKAHSVDVKVTEKHRTYQFDPMQNKLIGRLKMGMSDFSWEGTDFIVYKVTWSDSTLGPQAMYMLFFEANGANKAEKDAVGEELLTAAYKWDQGLKEEIYVFDAGHWSKDKKLWKAIQTAQRENLVLDNEFVSDLKRDTETFFSSREIYDSLEIPWKRGLILLGKANFLKHKRVYPQTVLI